MEVDTCKQNSIPSNSTGLRFAEETCLGNLPVAKSAVAESTDTVTRTVATNPTGAGGYIAGDLWDFIASSGSTLALQATGMTQTSGGLHLVDGETLDVGGTQGGSDVIYSVVGEATASFDGTAMTGSQINVTTDTAAIAIIGQVTIVTVEYDEDVTTPASAASTGPTWYPLEPNEYDDFGAEIQTVARNPISKSRQNRKGTITGVDATAGFEQDITQNNSQRLLQGFFFRDAKEQAGTGNLNTRGYVISSLSTASGSGVVTIGGSGAAQDFQDGSLISIRGAGISSNDGLYVVGAVGSSFPQVLGLIGQPLATEASPPASTKVSLCGFQFASGDLTITESNGTVLLGTTTKDFTEFGLEIGEQIFLGGDTEATRFDANQGYARVTAISANEITLSVISWPDPSTETGAGKTVQLFFGRYFRNSLESETIKQRSYGFERTLGEDEVGPQAEYIKGAVADEFELTVEQEDKLTANFGFVALDAFYRTGEDGLWPGDRPDLLSEDAFNTSSDVFLQRMYLHGDDSTPDNLFAYIREGSLSIQNGVRVDKAIGVIGGIGTSRGNFTVEGEVEAYFSTVAAVRAVRRNADVGLLFGFARENAGMFFDVPLVSLGGGRITIEADEPVLLPLETSASVNKYGYTASATFFDYLPETAMPGGAATSAVNHGFGIGYMAIGDDFVVA